MNVFYQITALKIRNDAKENLKKILMYFLALKRNKRKEVKNKSIAKKLDLSIRTIQRMVKRLEEMNILEVERRGLNKDLTKKLHSAMDFVNRYILKIEKGIRWISNNLEDYLKYKNIKSRKKGRNVIFDCPKCGAEKSLHLKKNKEVGYCHSCGDGMNVWSLIKK